MTHLKLFERYVDKLVKCLPMDDTHFIVKLSANRLLPGDTENKIKQLSTPSDKASYFLSHVIKPALEIDDVSNFKQLLSIMHNCGYSHVQNLSLKVDQDMNVKHIKSGILLYIVTRILHVYSLILLSISYMFSKYDTNT